MPLVSHNALPTFNRLRAEGQMVLETGRAMHQHIRELHIGLLNMMPDAALEPTERQFFRLVGESNPIAQFYMHPFTLKEQARGEEAAAHIAKYYQSFEQIQQEGLDALIITGATPTHTNLSDESFWEPLRQVVDWAEENVTSTFCSCLATHAVLEMVHGQKRKPLGFKRWGVFPHRVLDPSHPLVNDVNTQFDVPHSRFNDISSDQFVQADLHILVESEEAGVHLAVSQDRIRWVYCQGHPEYDTVSLLKEYKREIVQYTLGGRADYPRFPDNFFSPLVKAILNEYRLLLQNAMENNLEKPPFPDQLIVELLNNTWHDTAEGILANWIGAVYQLTHQERNRPYMDGIDRRDPFGLGLI